MDSNGSDGSCNDEDEEVVGLSRDYFLARELKNDVGSSSGSGKKRFAHKKICDINPVNEQALREELSRIEVKHGKEISLLLESYRVLYPNWFIELRYGFSLLAYGFGSKKALLEDFASTSLNGFGVVVINGFLPAINLKHAFGAIVDLLKEQLKKKRKTLTGSKVFIQSSNSQSTEEILQFLNCCHSRDDSCFVYVIIHNIDGPALRDTESQNHLARLASCYHVRVVASIDHVNAPLLWDKKMVHTEFNWCWHHVPTFVPYKAEGIFFPLILTCGGAAQTMKTALLVLQSLTPNARSVFQLLVEHQLAHEKDQGMTVNDLYAECRERFLVSSLVTLNTHLTEFRDHELLKTRKHPEGHECLYIPLAKDALEKLLQQLV